MSAKQLILNPISSANARKFIKDNHYSGKVVSNSTLHFGVFWNGNLEGVLQFGNSIDKRKTVKLVKNSSWNGFLELNRMAFSEKLPRNSESRALAISFKLIKKHYPHIKWIISFADGCQCGDGTIYRASGFILTAIKKNNQLYDIPNYGIHHKLTFEFSRPTIIQKEIRALLNMPNSSVSELMKAMKATPLVGFQLRYVYFLDKSYRENLTVPEIPFSKIKEMGAEMYKGSRRALVED